MADEWIVTIGGEVENPIEMSVTELKETFGTKTFTMKQPCIENATGNAWIFQAELTGISMKDIIDYVKPSDTVTNIKCTSEDGYNMVSPAFANVNVEDCLLVTEINGEPLPPTQGYPLTLAVPRNSAASYIKTIMTIDFVTKEGGSHTQVGTAGSPKDPHTGVMQAKPNSAVLNYPDGVVLSDQVGKPVTIEGYADAYDYPITRIEYSLDKGKTWTTLETPENDPTCWTYWRLTYTPIEGYADAYDYPITRIEYSLDKGKTWTTLETPENDPTCWTYWRLTYTPAEPGAYLLKVRAVCEDFEGNELVASRDTNFLFNVE